VIPSGRLVVEGTGGPERLIGAEEGAEPSCRMSRTSFEVILREGERGKIKRVRGSKRVSCVELVGSLVL